MLAVVTVPGPAPPTSTIEPISQVPAANGAIDALLPVSTEGLPASRGADPVKQHSGTSQFASAGGAPAASTDPGAVSIADEPPSGGIGGGGSPPILPESRQGTWLWQVRGVIRTLRPHQWVKNLFVLAPVVFAKHLYHPSIIQSAIGAFGVFCLLAGAVYTINDIADANADRLHPIKRHRPIASGRVPIAWAKAMAVTLVFVAFAGACLGPWPFVVVVVAYFCQNLAYSFGLKKIAYLDVACIAFGFVLRVLAGGFATKTPISGFMVTCTALLALFLGFGKRRHELASVDAGKQRTSLEAYSPRALTLALATTGIATVGTYFAYTLDHDTQRFFQNPYLWLTTVHPLFGVIRFLQLVVGRPQAESPTQEILRDTPFMLNLVMWIIEVIAIVYRLRPT